MGWRVLVVDDSFVMRVMLEEMLSSLGHEVVAEAQDVRAALAAYRKEMPDLVTLDICLPDENGLVALQKLRKIDLHVQVLLVTGSDQRAIEKKALDLAALAVLHKPFDLQELADVLEKISPRMRLKSPPEST